MASGEGATSCTKVPLTPSLFVNVMIASISVLKGKLFVRGRNIALRVLSKE